MALIFLKGKKVTNDSFISPIPFFIRRDGVSFLVFVTKINTRGTITLKNEQTICICKVLKLCDYKLHHNI